jgi:3-deoxy-manno-octulosonate cytidylyltransferase (CMP-KDO synthetase)
MKIVIGIPARMGSTRFPGKPLCDIAGMSMLEHCFIRCSLSKYATNLFIATCDDEIKEAGKKFGADVIMTAKNIQRPGLRVAEAAETLNLDDDDIVVVVQGDEPLVHPEMIDIAIEPLLKEQDVFVSNLCATASLEDLNDPGEIKVVCDLHMNALYMSRSAIPSIAHEESRAQWWKQVCIMPFRWHFLKKFNNELSQTPLEMQESIEMIRAIQHGYKVRMIPSKFLSKSVDSEVDRKVVEKMMREDSLFKNYGKKI